MKAFLLIFMFGVWDPSQLIDGSSVVKFDTMEQCYNFKRVFDRNAEAVAPGKWSSQCIWIKER